MEIDQITELSAAVLATVVRDRDISFVLSENLDLWCDVVSIEPNVFRERFLLLIKHETEELKQIRKILKEHPNEFEMINRLLLKERKDGKTQK